MHFDLPPPQGERTILMLASIEGDVKILQCLLEHKPVVDATDQVWYRACLLVDEVAGSYCPCARACACVRVMACVRACVRACLRAFVHVWLQPYLGVWSRVEVCPIPVYRKSYAPSPSTWILHMHNYVWPFN